MTTVTPEQTATLHRIENPEMRAAALKLADMECQVLVPDVCYRMGGREYSMRDLVAMLMSHVVTEDSKPLRSVSHVEMAVVRYQLTVGTTPLTDGLRKTLCAASPDPELAMAAAMEIVSWSRAGRPEALDERRERVIEEGAHLLLRWVENCKRRILGMDPEGQQLILDLWGESGAFKTMTAKCLIAPLGKLSVLTSALDHILNGHEGSMAAQYVAIWVDDAARLPKWLTPQLKMFVHAPTWRSNPKNKDARVLPMLASLICTHNPTPEEQYGDPAISRRLGAIHYPNAMTEVAGRRFVEERILTLDMVAFWRAVDPINRLSDDAIVQRAKKQFTIKDPVDSFMEECTLADESAAVLLQDLYGAFRTRAAAGGWDVRGVTDRTMAARLRSLRYDVHPSRKGVRIKGIALVEPGMVGPSSEAEES